MIGGKDHEDYLTRLLWEIHSALVQPKSEFTHGDILGFGNLPILVSNLVSENYELKNKLAHIKSIIERQTD